MNSLKKVIVNFLSNVKVSRNLQSGGIINEFSSLFILLDLDRHKWTLDMKKAQNMIKGREEHVRVPEDAEIGSMPVPGPVSCPKFPKA